MGKGRTSTPAWATVGWDKAEEQLTTHSTGFTREFFLKNGESAVIRILKDEPLNIRAHFFKSGWFTCPQGDEKCPMCEQGIKAQNKFVFQVLDTRKQTDASGVTRENEVKIWRTGSRVFQQLQILRNKYSDLTQIDLEVSRRGEGRDTTYHILPEFTDRDTSSLELYDLNESLAPKSRAELIEVLGDFEEDSDEDVRDDKMPWE